MEGESESRLCADLRLSCPPPVCCVQDLCGIAEGLIAFTREFSPDSLCESVHCQQHRYAFAQPEKNYWMVLVVKNPTIVTKDATGSGSKKDAGASVLHTEYLEDELEDSVLQAILHRCYSLFSLFNSSFTSIVKSTWELGGGSPTALAVAHDALRVRLSLFMSYFLPTIRFSQLIYFTDIHGFQFLPVDKITFLTIQYIIHLLTLNFTAGAAPPPPPPASLPPSAAAAATAAASSLASQSSGGVIKNVALMYNSKLIYSGLNSEIMFLLYSLDQDLMYWFLMEYLTEKEKISLEIQRFVAERAKIEAAEAAAAKEAAAADKPIPATKAWQVRRPPPIPGIYNVPESIYERNGRQATNRKAFDRAQNKGEVAPEEEFVEEDEEAAAAGVSQHTAGAGNEDDIVLLDGGVSRGGSASIGSSSSAASAAPPAPFGYMTGPFRVSNTPAANGAVAATLPGAHVSNCAPCINSPLIYLDGLDSLPQPGGAGGAGLHGGRAGAYGSGNPSLESNPAFASFPGAVPLSTDPGAPAKPLRLVVYQKYKITLFLIVEDQDTPPKTKGAEGAATAPSSSNAASASSSPAPSLVPHPPLSFYSALESFMESNLKKLGEMLFEQTVRLSSAGGVIGGVPVEEPYRFLYFNHMNLALKTSLSSSAPPAQSGSKGHHPNGSAGSVLTMETIKIIRELHRDFNTINFRQKQIASLSPHAPPPIPPKHQAHSIAHEGSTEVCVKTKHHGWVIGRRATQSHREFFLLLEDKVGNLADIQGQFCPQRRAQ